jgi:predicted metalloprotease with PDZ domain
MADHAACAPPSLRRALRCWLIVLGACVAGVSPVFHAAAPVQYRFTFPEPEHRWMQVEATFPDVGGQVLELRMSRASPGRYSLHDFAKNVWDVHAFARDGREVATARPDPYGWNVADHGGAVKVTYKIFGDVVDGTYLAVDTSHAHINMPAAIMWARGLDDRPATVTLAVPAGRRWQVATQLHPGSDALEFTAPNLQYLMDSPVEFGPLSMRQFSVGPRTFRLAVHHLGTDAELDDYVKDVERIVRQEGAVFGEYPEYEPGHYTFLADYLPYAAEDGMEHRNSSVVTYGGSIRANRRSLLDSVAHEFFHAWNVERIRPRSIEPFDFERANMSAELWLAEGFTQYYGPLILQRAGLADLGVTCAALTDFVETVTLGPGRALRSAEDMSRMAPFTDGGVTVDLTNWQNTYISYYPFGGAIALALDLALRERSDSRITLDDFMRAMWRVHGKPGGAREGYVDRPYAGADAEARLAEVSGDRGFAREFFSRYVEGREIVNYSRLLASAGLVVRKRHGGRAWWGDVRIEPRAGRLIVAALVDANSPAYAAGLERDDEIRQIDGIRVGSAAEAPSIVSRHKPGDRIRVAYVDRTGVERMTTVALVEDPHLQVVPAETDGSALAPAQRTFRERWLAASGSVPR